VGLDFAADFWREAGNEAAKEEGWGNVDDPVREILELR